MRMLAAFGAALLLPACQPSQSSEAKADAELVQKAEAAIRAELGETGGIDFRSSHVAPSARGIGMVCGEVTSPRFAGWRRYLYGLDAGLHQVEHRATDPGDPRDIRTNIALFDAQWRENCGAIPGPSDIPAITDQTSPIPDTVLDATIEATVGDANAATPR